MALFPAYAGVTLSVTTSTRRTETFPRTRGGDPNLIMVDRKKLNFSLHTRG